MDLLIGILLIASGIAVMKYRYFIYSLTGEWGWASQYLGGNGTITAIVLIGMILIGAGVGYPFGVFDKFAGPPNFAIEGKKGS